MKIQNVQYTPNFGMKNDSRLADGMSFKANPEQIITALKKSDLCFGEEQTLLYVAKFFQELGNSLPRGFKYKLGQTNKIPAGVNVLSINGETIAQMDEFMNCSKLQCSAKISCACKKHPKISEFVATFLKKMNLEEPDVISVGPKV